MKAPFKFLFCFFFFLFFTPFTTQLIAQSCCSEEFVDRTSTIGDAVGDGVVRYGWTDVFEWPNGDIISVHARFPDEGDFCPTDLYSKVSTDGGLTWPTASETIFESSNIEFFPPSSVDMTTTSLRNPGFLLSDDGTQMYMFFLVLEKNATCVEQSAHNDSDCNNQCPGYKCADLCTDFVNRIYWSKIDLPTSTSASYNPENWTDPVEVPTTAGYNVMNNARVIRLSNGTIAMAVTVGSTIDPFSYTTTNFGSYIIYSEDEGNSWETTAEVSITELSYINTAWTKFHRGMMEPDIVEIEDNGVQKVMMVMRTANTKQQYNTIPINNLSGSWDLTPTAPYTSTEFPRGNVVSTPPFPDLATNTPISIDRIPCSNDLLIVYNKQTSTNILNPNNYRTSLYSAISSDEGKTWKHYKELETSCGSGNCNPQYSYVSITFHGDKVWLTYYKRVEGGSNTSITKKYDILFREMSISGLYDANVKDVCPCINEPSESIANWKGEVDGTDRHGNYHATLENGAIVSTPAKVNSAFHLNGTNAYLSVDAPVANTPPFSVEAWVKPTVIDATNRYIMANGGETGSSNGFAFLIKNKKLRFQVRQQINGTNYFDYVESVNDMTSDWTHIAATWNEGTSGGEIKLYIDGMEVASDNSIGTGTVGTTANNLAIGSTSDFNSSYLWNGIIDEVGVYERVLSSSEIKGIYEFDDKGKCEPACIDTPSNLVAWWTGDTDGEDIQGTFNGTLNGDATAGKVGKVDGAFNFEGTGYVLANAAVKNTAPYSVEAWVKPSDLNGTQYIVSNGGQTGSSFGFALAMVSSKWRFMIRETIASAPYVGYAESATIPNTNWVHLVGTWNGGTSTDGLKLYVNGIEVDAVSPPAIGAVGLLTHNLTIGTSSTASFHWDGLIDEVRVFDKVLSPAEIDELYNSGSGGVCKDGMLRKKISRNIMDKESVFQSRDEDPLKIFPNPTRDGRLNVVLDGDWEGQSLFIYNSKGELMEEVKIQKKSFQLDIHQYISGLYFFKYYNVGHKVMLLK